MDLITRAHIAVVVKEAEYHYKRENYKTALVKYLKLLDLALKIREDALIAKFHELSGDCYERIEHNKKKDMTKDHIRAGDHYINAAKFYIRAGDREKAGEIFEKGAKTLEELEELGKAAEFFIKSAKMFIEIGDYFNASYTYHNAAEYYEKTNEYEHAAKTYLEAGLIDLKIKDTSNASMSFKHAGKNYEKKSMWQNAIDAYADAVEIDSLARKYLDVADSYERIGKVYLKIKDFKNSIHYHGRSAEIRMKNRDLANAAYSYREAGEVYHMSKDFENAIENYLKSAKLYEKTKTHNQAATSYMKTAKTYEELKDYKKAGKYYIEAAKSGEASKNQRMVSDGYMKAANSLEKYSDLSVEKNDFDEAEISLLEAATCFDTIKDYEMAANKYLKYADIMWSIDQKEKAIKGYRKSAEEYIKAGKIWDAAESYYYTHDFDTSANTFIEYAKTMEEYKDFYSAAAGYLHTSLSIKKLNRNTIVKQYALKAVNLMRKYIEGFTKPPDKGKELLQYAEGRRMLGECHQILLEYRDSKRQYSKALELYKKVGDESRIVLATALLRKMEAEHKIDHGYYPEASKILQEAQTLFEETIKDSNWRRMYVDYLKENLEDVIGMIEMIELKPKVILEVDQRTYTFSNIPLIINFELTNTGRYTMKRISFLEHLPDEINLTRLPDPIEELQSKSNIRGSVELTPTETGFYRIKPLEVYYEDQEAHKYVKACNEISVEVEEQPPTDFKNYQNAVQIFIKYAKSQKENKNWFQAGDGYREASETYGKFNTDHTLREYFKDSRENYKKYVEENSDKEQDDPTKVKRLGDALWFAGEQSRLLEELDDAGKDYEESVIYYRACKMLHLADRSLAFKKKTEGIRFIKHGDYEKAQKSLEESLTHYNDVVKWSGFTIDEIKYYERSEDEIKNLLATIKQKPEISVSVIGPVKAAIGETITYKAMITNPQEFNVTSVRAVVKPVDGLETLRKPDLIPSIEPGKTTEIEFKIKPLKEGDYKFIPLDITYNDDKDNSYMKGSDEVSISIKDEKIKDKEPDAIESKDVVLNIDNYSYNLVGCRFILNAEVINKSGDELREVNFLSNLPPHMKVISSPHPLLSLKNDLIKKISIEINPTQAGKYKMKPIELFYKDPAGNKYVKASNDVQIEVVERPPTDYKNFMQGVEIFVKYARNQKENKNWFQSGDGYREAAETYSKFKSDNILTDYYNEAVENYDKYIDENKAEKDDHIVIKRVGDAARYCATCLTGIGSLKDAINRLELSAKFYDNANTNELRDVVTAHRDYLNGRIGLEQGEYNNAEKLLTTSVEKLTKSIKTSGLDMEFIESLVKTRSEANLMLENIRTKPDLMVQINVEKEVVQRETFVIETVLTNMSQKEILEINTEPLLPKDIILDKKPETIPLIEPGKTEKTFMQAHAKKEGEFKFKPFNIRYKDSEARNYQKGTTELTIKITQKKDESILKEEATISQEESKDEGHENIILKIRSSEKQLIGEPTSLKVEVINHGRQEVTKVRFIGTQKDGLEIGEKPDSIERLDPGERKEFEYQIKPLKKGKTSLKPLEMFYKDVHGNGFFKSSNEIELNVIDEEEEKDDKLMIQIESGKTYLLEDPNRERSIKVLNEMMEEGYSGLYFTRTNPDQIKEEYKLIGVKYAWITDVKGESKFNTTTSPQEISILISDFLSTNEKTIILIEGLEYLINITEFNVILKFVQFIRDKISTRNSILLILIDSESLDPKQQSRLEHECILYGK